jgi:hypothetical protein
LATTSVVFLAFYLANCQFPPQKTTLTPFRFKRDATQAPSTASTTEGSTTTTEFVRNKRDVESTTTTGPSTTQITTQNPLTSTTDFNVEIIEIFESSEEVFFPRKKRQAQNYGSQSTLTPEVLSTQEVLLSTEPTLLPTTEENQIHHEIDNYPQGRQAAAGQEPASTTPFPQPPNESTQTPQSESAPVLETTPHPEAQQEIEPEIAEESSYPEAERSRRNAEGYGHHKPKYDDKPSYGHKNSEEGGYRRKENNYGSREGGYGGHGHGHGGHGHGNGHGHKYEAKNEYGHKKEHGGNDYGKKEGYGNEHGHGHGHEHGHGHGNGYEKKDYGNDKKDYGKKEEYGHGNKDYGKKEEYGHDHKDYGKKEGYGHDHKDYGKKEGYGHDHKDYGKNRRIWPRTRPWTQTRIRPQRRIWQEIRLRFR